MSILKKTLCLFLLPTACSYAADLIEVYNAAQQSDPIFQQAIAQKMSTKAGLPISIAALLPQISFNASPSISRQGISGVNIQNFTSNIALAPRNTTIRSYNMTLMATQTIFDFSQFAAVRGAYSLAKGAEATLNAELQKLMIRVAKAYFAVLKDEDKIRYSLASKRAFSQQLDQVKDQYNVGLKTVTEVDTAQASYDTAVANYIAAQTDLNNDRENLRVLTGNYYSHLLRLRDDFPLITPAPQDMDKWVETAEKQNWSIKAAQYALNNKLQIVRQQYAGHLPTVQAEITMQRQYSRNISGYDSFMNRQGPGTQTNRMAAINIDFPIFSGGGVVAKTNQAKYNYELAQQQLEQTIRETLNTTRKSYLSIMTGISQIKADKQAIKSTISSLLGIRASFQVGTETLVDVLNQQQKVFEKQMQYANDRYDFVNNVLALKQAAGTLNFDDLKAINTWLTAEKEPQLLEKNTKVHSKKPIKSKMKLTVLNRK